ncbi:hypothetical protein ABEB36_005064 [Hypothenemus hampei]|uniref:Anaphase-promoting complex subunit 4 n=1 Tax=Hypothenemus hampei TaxID=57062 RepID=A0ABD1EXG2_HYPHA
MSQGIKQLEEKNVASDINCMVWSSRMDLIAYSNTKGEVALHRLSWTRAWVLSPPKEGVTVKGIAWRPDGKVLAVAYSDSNVVLINVETKATLIKFHIPGEVSFISWIQEKCENKSSEVLKINDDVKEIVKFIDLSKPYIKDPPPVSHLEGSINFEDIKGLTSFLQEQSEFNLLIIGTKHGLIHIRIFGCWNCLILDVSNHLSEKCCIQNAHFTEDLNNLLVTVTDERNNISTVLFHTYIFKTNSLELYHITMKYIKLYELILYLERMLSSITETWESILLEVDKKLARYANHVPEGGVTADFLDLLMFGVCSDKLEEFLICDLTKKGLEKFGHTMEISYSNIQSYLFRHIIKYSQNGILHLSELRGMAMFEEKFGVIGLDSDVIQNAIRSNGAFVIKASEMQQIINHSVITYKAFFRWLYSAIMHLMEEPVPAEIQKMTQQDLNLITEFVQNFDFYGQGSNKKDNEHNFIMERLGQYLMDENLKIKPDMSGNDWTQFMEENECLKMNPSLFTHYIEKSLIQVFNELQINVQKVFESPLTTIGKSIVPVTKFNCLNFNISQVNVSSVNVGNNVVLKAILNPQKSIDLYQISFDQEGRNQVKCCNLYFNQQQSLNEDEVTFDVADIEFYSSNILSVLLRENSNSRKGGMFQLQTASILEHLVEIDLTTSPPQFPRVNVWPLNPRHYKSIDMPVSQFSVSGTRRVCLVLSENKRKVKLYEMECEEDEEEDADMSSVVKDESFVL